MGQDEALRIIQLEGKVSELQLEIDKLEAIHAEQRKRDRALADIERERDLELQMIAFEKKIEGLRKTLADEMRKRVELERAAQHQRDLEPEVEALLDSDRDVARRFYQKHLDAHEEKKAALTHALKELDNRKLLLELEPENPENRVLLERLPVEQGVLKEQVSIVQRALDRYQRCLDTLMGTPQP